MNVDVVVNPSDIQEKVENRLKESAGDLFPGFMVQCRSITSELIMNPSKFAI